MRRNTPAVLHLRQVAPWRLPKDLPPPYPGTPGASFLWPPVFGEHAGYPIDPNDLDGPEEVHLYRQWLDSLPEPN